MVQEETPLHNWFVESSQEQVMPTSSSTESTNSNCAKLSEEQSTSPQVLDWEKEIINRIIDKHKIKLITLKSIAKLL